MKDFDRRQLLRSASLFGGGLALAGLTPAWAMSATAGTTRDLPTLTGPNIDLRIGHASVTIDGRMGHAAPHAQACVRAVLEHPGNRRIARTDSGHLRALQR